MRHQLRSRIHAHCIAETETGAACNRPASVPDFERGGMVCTAHAPQADTQQDKP